jgi:hypothetical protein
VQLEHLWELEKLLTGTGAGSGENRFQPFKELERSFRQEEVS